MKFLKITTTDNTLEYLALDKILSIQPQNHRIKILMGAGLYWWAERETMEILSLPENFDEIIEIEFDTRGL